MSFHFTWKPMTTQISMSIFHGMALGSITRALTISWSRPLAIVQIGSQLYAAVYQLGVGWDDECIGTNLTLHWIIKVSFPCQLVIYSISDALEHPPCNALCLALQIIKCNQTHTSHTSKLSHHSRSPPLSRPQSLQFPIQISKKTSNSRGGNQCIGCKPVLKSHWSCRTYPYCRLPLGLG